MKTSVLLAAVLVAAFVPCQAQEPAVSSSSVADLPPLFPAQDLFPAVPAPSLAPAEAPQPEATPAPGTAGQAAPKKGTAEQLRQAIRLRELKTEVKADPAVQAELDKARCAKTEEGRRRWMRNYYTLLYAKIDHLDPTLHDLVVKERIESLLRYEQHMVRPSVLIEPVTSIPGSCAADPIAPAPAAASQKTPAPSPTPAPQTTPNTP